MCGFVAITIYIFLIDNLCKTIHGQGGAMKKAVAQIYDLHHHNARVQN